MNRSVMSALFVAAMSATMAAQSHETMDKNQGMSRMASMDKMGGDMTYTGCLQTGSAPGTFILSNANPMMKNAMPKEVKTGDTMSHGMMTTTLALTTTSVDLRKYVGHRVSVTGSSSPLAKDAMGKDQSIFAVKTLTMVAAACS